MKKVIFRFVIICAVIVAAYCVADIALSHAEEPVEEVVETNESGFKAQISDLIAYYNGEKEDNYFAENILPLLLGIGSSIIGLIGCAVPWIKTHAKYKQLQGAYAALIDQTNNLKKIISSTDPHEIERALSAIVTDEFKAQMHDVTSKIKVDYEALGEVKGQLQTVCTQLQALSSAANVVWRSEPKAVALLSAAPTQAAVDKIAAENAKLKAYIRALNDKGEEIVKEIIAR